MDDLFNESPVGCEGKLVHLEGARMGIGGSLRMSILRYGQCPEQADQRAQLRRSHMTQYTLGPPELVPIAEFVNGQRQRVRFSRKEVTAFAHGFESMGHLHWTKHFLGR